MAKTTPLMLGSQVIFQVPEELDLGDLDQFRMMRRSYAIS